MSSKIFSAAVGTLAVFLGASEARASHILVNDGHDNWAGLTDTVHGNDGFCTLREAVASAYFATRINYVAPNYPQGYKINDCDPGSGYDSIIFAESLQQIEIDTEVLGSINLTYNQYPFDPGSISGSNSKVQSLTISSGSPGFPYRDLEIVRKSPNSPNSNSFFTMSDGLSSDRDPEKKFLVFLRGMTFRGGLTSGVGGVLNSPSVLSEKAHLWIEWCKFLDNKAGLFGGAIALNGGRAQIYLSLFKGNYAGQGVGAGGDGGALSFGGGYHVIDGNLFVENSARGGGGAIHCAEARLSLHLDYFLKNTANDLDKTKGGGAIMNKCGLKVVDGVFVGNIAKGAGVGGGAVYVVSHGEEVLFQRTIFEENEASTPTNLVDDCFVAYAPRCTGGAIAALQAITVRESAFRYNSSAGNVGGAIFLNHGSSTPSSIINSQFDHNKTKLLQEVPAGIHPEGGAIALGGYGNQDTSALLTGNTIIRNGGKSQVYSQGFASGQLRNNIVGTNDDLIPVIGMTVHQINCNGNFSGVAGSVQSTEGSANSSCPGNIVDYAQLGEATGTHQFECADPSMDGAPTDDLGRIEPQDFTYYRFTPAEPNLFAADSAGCHNAEYSNGIDLLNKSRAAPICTTGAVEN